MRRPTKTIKYYNKYWFAKSNKLKHKLAQLYPEYIRLNQTKEDILRLDYLINKISKIESKYIKELKNWN